MKPRDALVCGLALLIVAAVLYTIYTSSTEVYSDTNCDVPLGYSYSHCLTHNVVECKSFGVRGGDQCTFYAYIMYGACGVLSFVGVVMVAVSLYRIIERPMVSALPAPPLGLCPKCGAMNPPTSKFCNECATKL